MSKPQFRYSKRFNRETKSIDRVLMFFDGWQWHDFPTPDSATWASADDMNEYREYLKSEERRKQQEYAREPR